MNTEEMMKHADKLLGYVVEGIEQSKEFVAEQAPKLVQEIVTWGIVEHLLYVVFLLALSAFGLWFVNWNNKKLEKFNGKWDSDKIDYQMGRAFTIVGVLACQGLILLNVVTIFKAWFAPRLYLLEVLRGLIKSST